MMEMPPETCWTLMESSRSAVPRALTNSRMASLGIVPVPCLPGLPTKSRGHVSRVTSFVVPEAHATVGRSKRLPAHQLGYLPVECAATSIAPAHDFPD